MRWNNIATETVLFSNILESISWYYANSQFNVFSHLCTVILIMSATEIIITEWFGKVSVSEVQLSKDLKPLATTFQVKVQGNTDKRL